MSKSNRKLTIFIFLRLEVNFVAQIAWQCCLFCFVFPKRGCYNSLWIRKLKVAKCSNGIIKC